MKGKGQVWKLAVALGVGLAAVGCARVQTRVAEVPRVDQELQGNGGYLMGKSSEPVANRKTTRQIIMTDVELATGQEIKSGIQRRWPWGKKETAAPQQTQVAAAPTRTPMPVAPSQSAEAEDEYEQAPNFEEAQAPAPSTTSKTTTYVVQKGDNLEKIAKKVYGNSNKWSRIYKANRDVLKNPNMLRVGQKLTLPALPEEETHQASIDETLK